MNSSTSGMPVSSDRVRILKSDRTRLTISARTMPSTSPEGWFDTTTSGPVGGIRAISSGGVWMVIPMWRIAFGQKGEPKGAPDFSNLRIRRRSWTLAVIHSMARIVPAFHGFLKVPA
jgi:hypothetical protein